MIETKADSHDAFVYSNGTGMFVDQNSRVEIGLFAQEPFKGSSDQDAGTSVEPSVSQSSVTVVRGSVGICSSQLLPGSTMTYTTPQAVVVIRSGRVSIETANGKTTVDLLDGDVTVRSAGKDGTGQILRSGDRAVILSAPAGQSAAVSISQTPTELQPDLDHRVTIACNAKKTVTFKIIEQQSSDSEAAGAGQEIVVQPTVPANLPTNITISADRLPGGT